MHFLFRALFYLAWIVGKPFGGIRPRRIYTFLGRRAFLEPQFEWRRDCWGLELRLAPFYHIDRDIIVFGCYDPDLHAAIERLVQPGMICMDIGSNLGEMALHMARRVGVAGCVYAFEPVSAVFARLQEHTQRNKLDAIVKPCRLALSNANGSLEIACADSRADNQGLGSIVNRDNAAVALRESVETQTLDSFAARHNITRIDFMKVDIQGAEYFLLEGGARVFSELGPDLLIEISPEDLRQCGKNTRDLCVKLEAYGYTIFELRRGQPGRRIDGSTVAPDFHAINVYCTKKK
jgi:FkbM family methyltransferase